MNTLHRGTLLADLDEYPFAFKANAKSYFSLPVLYIIIYQSNYHSAPQTQLV